MSKAVEIAHEAVLFLSEHQVVNQMRYSEFEALLDGVVTMPDKAGQEVQAVYVQLDKQLLVRALVCFQLYFDDEGRADSEWNVPLQRLAKISGTGPDLGAGPVKLAMRSQCAISWHQKDLWDPSSESGANDLQAIRKALKENRLGLPVVALAKRSGSDKPRREVEDENIPTLERDEGSDDEDDGEDDELDAEDGLDSAERRSKLARQIRNQRVRLKTLTAQHDAEISELLRQHRLEIQAHRTQLRELEQSVEHLKVLNDQGKDKLARRNEQYLLLQNEVSHYKKRFALLEKELSKALPEDEAERMKKRMEGEVSILRDQLDRREAELFYRDEREEQLKAEVSALKEQLESIEKNEIIHQLADLDVVFVVYHPGAGHITLPAGDVRRYAANPLAYVAERCFVSEEHYQQWLEHYENPVCTHSDKSGNLCGVTLPRVTAPSDFEPGQDNRCEAHR
jgi:hypothetical protein